MKKHIAKTISILSLLATLLVGARNVSAGGGCTTCQPKTTYAAQISSQNGNLVPARDAGQVPVRETTPIDIPPESSANSIELFWALLSAFFTFLW